MSDTPRTDVAQSTIWNAYENRWQAATEAMNFARQLEREIASAQDSVVALRDLHKDALREIAALKEDSAAWHEIAGRQIDALKAENERLRDAIKRTVDTVNERIRAALEEKP